MQSHFSSPYWRSDSSHCNEPTLGGYQLLLSKIQGTQALIHYIERSTTQLVEYKALNFVNVGSSPMVEITSYDVNINELYTKVPAQYYLTEPVFGGYTLLLKYTWSYLQSPCSLLHNDPALGGYTGWSFYQHKAITSPMLLQAWQPGTWGLHMWNIQFMTNDWDE